MPQRARPAHADRHQAGDAASPPAPPTPRPPGSGKAMARTGLRMMPTFPSPPLSFRTAGFPQYGCKAGISGDAFPRAAPVKPAPGMPGAPRSLPSPFVLAVAPGAPALCVADLRSSETPPCERLSRSTPGALAPIRVMLSRFITTYGPHPPHSRARRDFPAQLVIRDAFAVREHLGDPRLVPCFRCPFLPDMSPSTSPGSSSTAYTQFLRRQRGPSHPRSRCSALPSPPPSASGGHSLSGLPGSLRYDLPVCSPSWRIRPRSSPSRRGLLRLRFRRVGHPPRRQIWLRWQLGKLHRRDFHPLDRQLASLHTGAALMRRVFDLDVLACPRCGGRLRVLATIQDPAVVRAILAHLRLPLGPDRPGPAPPAPEHTAATE